MLAQTIYLWLRVKNSVDAAPLSSWFDWLLLVAWGLVAAYLATVVRRPQAAIGIFVLPLVLLFIGVASLFRDVAPFPRAQAQQAWGIIHGISLLLGTVVVMLGFVAGVMYLVQSYRLKHKLPPRQGLKLPSLEWLQSVNKLALLVSVFLLAAGLISGIILNLLKQGDGVPWTDPVVWTSGVLLLWLIAATIFEICYKPAQQGRKVAYLTVASFVFLGLVLGIVLWSPSEHAAEPKGDSVERNGVSMERQLAANSLVWMRGELR